MKRLVFLIFSCFAIQAQAFNVGFNQAWFKTSYSTQYLDMAYDESEVERIFQLALAAGSKEIRLWFFEGHRFPMINFDGEAALSLKDDFKKNVMRTLALARKHQLKVYMTFFDAHAYRPDKLSKKELQRYKYFLSENGLQNFISILLPFFEELKQNGLLSVISKLDIINEGDTLVFRNALKNWDDFSRFLCQVKKSALMAYLPSLSISVRLHPLVFLPSDMLDDQGPLKCADFIDFHSYNNEGKIKNCEIIRSYANTNKKKLVLGEFGQGFFTKRYSDVLQKENTEAYLKEAVKCGFSEGLAWRLSDIRDGFNPEARYSFEAFGVTRPAYSIIQTHNSFK